MISYLFRVAAAALITIAAGACTTGERMGDIREGMSKDQVIAVLGRPDGFRREGNAEALTYVNRLTSGWSWDKADYHVVLTDGRVSAYGPGMIRSSSGPNVGVLTIVPLR